MGYGQNHYHSHNHNVTVTEKRASTDESLKLLKEMEEKIKGQLIGEIKFEDNILNAVALVYQDKMATPSMQYSFWLKFSVNGYQYIVYKKIDRWEEKDRNIFQKVQDEAKAVIINHIFKHLKVEVLQDLGVLKSQYVKNELLEGKKCF